MPKVSIIVPSWNYGRYLPESLDSVFAQSLKDVEVVVVDNGSTDGTEQALAPYRGRIVYRYQEHELSWMVGINRAMSLVTGAYLNILPADDVLLPGALERCVDALERHPSAAFAYSPAVTFGDGAPACGHKRNGAFSGDARVMPGRAFVESLLRYKQPNPDPASVLLRTNALREIGPFDEVNTGLSDFDMYCRLALRHDVCFVDGPQSLHRMHTANRGIHAERATLHADQLLRVFRRLMDDPLFPERLRRRRCAIMARALWYIAVGFLLDFRRPLPAMRYGWQGLRASPLGFAVSGARWTGIALQHRLARR